MSLEPGAKIRLISEAGICYQGKLVKTDEEEGTITLERVLCLDTTTKKNLESSAAAASDVIYELVVFRQSEVKEVKVLDADDAWPTDSAVIKAVEDCTASRARKFSGNVLRWIQKGDNKKTMLILDNSYLHELFDASKKTLLHYAVKYNNLIIVNKLLAMGSDVNAQDSMGMTPLMMAMEERRKDSQRKWAVIEAILAAGADILILNKEGKSAVHTFCAYYEDFCFIGEELFENLKNKCPCRNDEVDALVGAGCTVYQVYKFLGDLRTVEMMLQRGLPVNDLDSEDNESALWLAVTMRDVECIQLLLQYGADPETKNPEGETPLVFIFMGEELEVDKEAKIVRLLLEHGASPTSCTFECSFQARHLLVNGRRDAIRALLENNLDFTAQDEDDQRYPLHFLAINCNPGVVEELKFYKNDVDVNVRDDCGATPLHWAVKNGNVEMVKFLLSMGADVNAVHETRGVTPLYFTCWRSRPAPNDKYDQCAELLLQHHADPQFEYTTDNGRQITLFKVACAVKDLRKIRRLFVAQLAIMERRGTEIVESIQAKINSHPVLKDYLRTCRRLLKQEISGSVTLFKLLLADKRKMARFLENEELSLRLEGFMGRLKCTCLHYYNWLQARHSVGARYGLLRGDAALSICKIFGENVDAEHLVIHRIIDFIDDESLECLKNLL